MATPSAEALPQCPPINPSSPRRPWSAPSIEALPKLTELTLASPIGGGGGIGGSTVFGLLLAAGLLFGVGACADQDLSRPSTSARPAATSQLMTCRADVATGTVTCAGPARTSGQATLGSQGLNVGLRSSNVSYNLGTGVFSADVTVQNLTSGPIGTLDGTTKSSGVSVFFVSGPTPDVGTASVANATGTATFTASNQPYFLYNVLLGSQGVSAAQTWQFQLGGGATSFTFAVLVSADVPVVGGVLRWTDEPGFLPEPLMGIRSWGTGFAVFGSEGEVLSYDQGKWTSRHDPGNVELTPYQFAAASGPNDILRFPTDNTIRSWDGAGWQSIESQTGGPGNGGNTFGVGSSSATGDYAIGFSNLWTHAGNSWSADAIPPTAGAALTASTPLLGGILTIGYGGELWFYRQHAWTRVDSTSSGMGATAAPYLLIAADTSHVWAFQASRDANAAEYWNGTAWSVPALPHNYATDRYLPTGGYAVNSNDVYLSVVDSTSNGYLWHWDGATWSLIRNTTGGTNFYNDVSVTSNGNVYLAEETGSLEMDSAGAWSTVLAGAGPAVNTNTAWVLGASNAYLGNNAGQIYHYDGTRWTKVRDLGGGSITSLWAFGSEAWAAHFNYVVEYYNGSSWSAVNVASNNVLAIAVGGSSASDVWAVGSQGGIAHYNGSAWSLSATPNTLTSNDLHGVWAADASHAYAVGVGGTIVAWDGSAWSLATSPTSNPLNAVSGTSATDVWAVGNGGTIVHWNGSAWSTVTSGTTTNLTGVWARSPGEVYAVGDGSSTGTVLRYDGTAWEPVAVLSAASSFSYYTGVAGSPSGSALITGNWTLRGNP